MARFSPLPSPGRPPPIQPFHKTISIDGKLFSPSFQKAKGCKPRYVQGWAVPCVGRWRGWTSGVETIQAGRGKRAEREGSPVGLALSSSRVGNTSSLSSYSSPSSRSVSQKSSLGFPDDLVGARPLPHLAAFLFALWRLPTKAKTSFCGRSVHFRSPPSSDPWPRVGIGSQIPRNSVAMDPKGKNAKWDRQIPKPQRQNSPPWGRHRNLSWRLRPPQMKTETKQDVQITSSGKALIQKETSRKMLLEGSSLLRRMVKEIFDRKFGWAPVDKRLCN